MGTITHQARNAVHKHCAHIKEMGEKNKNNLYETRQIIIFI